MSLDFLGAEKRGEPMPLRQNEVNRILGVVDDMADSEEEINIPYVARRIGEGDRRSFQRLPRQH